MGNDVRANLVYGFVVLDDEGEVAQEYPPAWLAAEEDEGGALSLGELILKKEGRSGEGWEVEQKVEEESGLVLVDHCRSECPMWILGVTASLHDPYRGKVASLGQLIEAKSEWREILKSFCDRFDVPFTEPQWLLAPYSQ